LHDFRFAVTLWKKEPGETAFRRYDDIQYISQISTEDKKCKNQIYSILMILFIFSSRQNSQEIVN
jgi:hypothetical protein